MCDLLTLNQVSLIASTKRGRSDFVTIIAFVFCHESDYCKQEYPHEVTPPLDYTKHLLLNISVIHMN